MNENLIVELESKGILTPTFRRLSSKKKARIYDIALNMFSKLTYDQVSLDILANRADISKGSIFQYFEKKRNLLDFVIYVYIDHYHDFWKNYFEIEQPIRMKERISKYFTSHIDYFKESPHELDFYFKILYENDREISSQFSCLIDDCQLNNILYIVERGITTGEIRQDMEAIDMANILLINLRGFIGMYFEYNTLKTNNRLGYSINGLLNIIFDGLSGK